MSKTRKHQRKGGSKRSRSYRKRGGSNKKNIVNFEFNKIMGENQKIAKMASNKIETGVASVTNSIQKGLKTASSGLTQTAQTASSILKPNQKKNINLANRV